MAALRHRHAGSCACAAASTSRRAGTAEAGHAGDQSGYGRSEEAVILIRSSRVSCASQQTRRPMSEMGVRRDKAALSSGCKSHPANAPAGSNRSSYGGNEVAEAFGVRVTNW
jgi:hypothetical protein